ncbi:MAG: four helix bundle protein [Candidatus Cloacimonetes bacterium]|nr:four helix bundle protein [Candidatus Cloacimonadota bacterium]
MKTYREIICWQKAIELVKSIYKITNNFPQSEQFGLTSQLRRAAISIPSNIAEGFGRSSNKEFRRFLEISRGSLFELQTQLFISKELGFIISKSYDMIYEQTREVERILIGFINSLKV